MDQRQTQEMTQELRSALDRITSVAGNPDQVRAAVNEVKTKLDQLLQQQQQGR